jgi:hypothetical protein
MATLARYLFYSEPHIYYMVLRDMDRARVRTFAALSLIIVSFFLFALPTLLTDVVVDHHQVYELESQDYFSAGVGSLNDSFVQWIDLSIDSEVGETDLGLGEHALWVQRLDGEDTMWDVVNLYIEDDGRWVPYHRPSRLSTMERDGVEYELMFIIDVTSSGNHTIESMGSSYDLSGEQVHIMVTHRSEVDLVLLLPGLVLLLCGIVLLVHGVVTKKRPDVPP